MTMNQGNKKFVFLIPSIRPGGAKRNCIRLANTMPERCRKVEIWLRERSPIDLVSLLNEKIVVFP